MEKADPVKRAVALLIDAFLAGVVFEALDVFLPHSLALTIAWSLLLLRDAPPLPFHRSPGKKTMGLITRQLNDNPLGWNHSVKRNLPLVIGPASYGFLLFVFAISPHFGQLIAEIISLIITLVFMGTETWKMFTDPAGVRLGDILAGTKVQEEF